MDSDGSLLNNTDRKLLIIHSDDLGMCHSVNLATFDAFAAGAISSASIMVPCPWFVEAADHSRHAPDCDIGIHLTLTNEWESYKWGPSCRRHNDASQLTDMNGYFRGDGDVLAHVSPAEIMEELRSQIAIAYRSGLSPTHIDNHMFSLISPQLIGTYIWAGQQHGLPILMDAYWRSYAVRAGLLTEPDATIACIVHQADDPRLPVSELEDYYLHCVRELQPGLNQLIVHLGYDNSELRGITRDRKAFGAAWRQKDFEVVMSHRFRAALLANDVEITNWKRVGRELARIKVATTLPLLKPAPLF